MNEYEEAPNFLEQSKRAGELERALANYHPGHELRVDELSGPPPYVVESLRNIQYTVPLGNGEWGEDTEEKPRGKFLCFSSYVNDYSREKGVTFPHWAINGRLRDAIKFSSLEEAVDAWREFILTWPESPVVVMRVVSLEALMKGEDDA